MNRPDRSATDPLISQCLELCRELEERTQRLRDYATTPGNGWLAKGELQSASQLLVRLDELIDQLKADDRQSPN